MRSSVFTEAEQKYLESQPLGRLATLGPDGAPEARPVGFSLNAEFDTIDIGGFHMAASRKYRNVGVDGRVTFVVDDLATTDPWRPRGIEIRGTAEALAAEPVPDGTTADIIRIHPTRIFGWGLDTAAFAGTNARTIRR